MPAPTSLPVYRPVGAVPATAASLRPVQFGGAVDALAKAIGTIDGNQIIQMSLLDVGGMCIPRTWLEARMRPPGSQMDAARETAIREVMGMICNVFLAGWFAWLMLRLLGKSVNWHNPHGIPPQTQISAGSLDAFGKLFRETLATAPSHAENPQALLLETRRQFIRKTLASAASLDKELIVINRLQDADALNGKAKVDYLRQTVHDFVPNADRLLGQIDPASSWEQQTDALRKLLQSTPEIKLRPEALDELCRAFELKDALSTDRVLGTNDFNARAMARVRETRATLEEEARRLGRPLDEVRQSFDEAKAFKQARLNLTLDDLRHTEKDFLKRIGAMAKSGNLTSTIKLLGSDGKPLISSIGRDTFLTELKHYLEQFVDRAGHQVDTHGDWKTQLARKLFAPSTKNKAWRRFIPQAQDSLYAAALKSKWAYLRLPLAGAVLVGISVGFFNNWLTRRRHGGQDFFPGNGLPGSTHGSGIGQTVYPATMSGGLNNPLHHPPRGVFNRFTTQRASTMRPGGTTA